MKIEDLVSHLVTEMLQAETSAKEHPRKEAERLEGTPPGAAMLAVSVHAERELPELTRLAEKLGVGTPSVGAALGKTLSVVREATIDRLVSQEKNYRATLSGLQHGLDVILFLEAAARHAGVGSLADFCARLLAERRPLVDAVRAALVWLAEHPERA